MKEITLTKGFVAIVDDDDYEWLAQYKWYACEKRHLQEVYATRAVISHYGEDSVLNFPLKEGA